MTTVPSPSTPPAPSAPSAPSATRSSTRPSTRSSSRPGPDSAGPAPCPCGTGAPYTACCGRYHAGEQALQAPTAEALMRSRYSACVLGLHDYLLATWHPRTRPASLAPDPPGLRWLGLEVKAHRQQDDDHATVHFVARSKQGGRAERLQETSRFVRENGRWTYVDGDLA